MKRVKIIFLLITLVFPNFILVSAFFQANQNSYHSLRLFADDGVSKDEYNQSVTYKVKISFSLTHNQVDDQKYILNVARINDRDPDNENTKYTPPYQESELKKNEFSGYDILSNGVIDEYGNTFDRFNATLSTATKTQIEMQQEYEVKLSEIYFKEIKDDDIGEYNYSEDIFELYCNNSIENYEIDDPDLITASNSIVDSDDNPVEKAEKIYDWVIDYLDYDEDMPVKEKGASWAYDNERGDCSEYSSLMITLLRIQKIPARKVLGYVISNNPLERPEEGDSWTFTNSYDGSEGTLSSSFLGHAWVEYYVPEIGWIVCDPTWGEVEDFDYFNRIDFFHLATTVGEWINFGSLNYSEFPYAPNPAYSDFPTTDDSAFDFEVKAKIEVLETDLIPIEELEWWEVLLQFLIENWILVSILAIILVVSIIVIVKLVKKRKADRY